MRTQKSFFNIFLGYLTKKGKKVHARSILDDTFFELSKRFKIPSHIILKHVLKKMGNILEVKVVKKRKNTFVIPFSIGFKRRSYLTAKKVMDSIKEDTAKKSFKDKLVYEFAGILMKDKYSKSLQKNKSVFKEALQYRSNTHFRW